MESLPSLDRLTHLIHGTSPNPAVLRYAFASPPPYDFFFAPQPQTSQILDAVNFQLRTKGSAWSVAAGKEVAFENGCKKVVVGEVSAEGEGWEVQIEAK